MSPLRTSVAAALALAAGTTIAGPLGSSPADAAYSAKQLLTYAPGSASGVYWFDSDGAGGAAPFLAYADMTTQGGGWMLAVNSVAGSISASNDIVAHTGTVGLTTGHTRDLAYLAIDQTAQLRHHIVDLSPATSFHGWYTGTYHGRMAAMDGWTFMPGTNVGLLAYHFGMAWTTPTLDRDAYAGGNCAAVYGTSWYHNACFSSIPSAPMFGNTPLAYGNVDRYSIWIRETAIPPAPVPEPGGVALLLAGLGAVGFVARRRIPA